MGDIALTRVRSVNEAPGQRRRGLAAAAILASIACLFVAASINGAAAHFYPRLVSADIGIGPILTEYSDYVTGNALRLHPVYGALGAYYVLTRSDPHELAGLIFGLSFSIAPMFLWAIAIHVLVGYIAMARAPVIDVESVRRRVLPFCAALALIAGIVLSLLVAFDIGDIATDLLFSTFFSAFSLLTVFIVIGSPF